jgi:hypothetical protein
LSSRRYHTRSLQSYLPPDIHPSRFIYNIVLSRPVPHHFHDPYSPSRTNNLQQNCLPTTHTFIPSICIWLAVFIPRPWLCLSVFWESINPSTWHRLNPDWLPQIANHRANRHSHAPYLPSA